MKPLAVTLLVSVGAVAAVPVILLLCVLAIFAFPAYSAGHYIPERRATLWVAFHYLWDEGAMEWNSGR